MAENNIEKAMEYWNGQIPDEAVDALREEMLVVFKQAKRDDFKSEECICGMVSTRGYESAIKKVFAPYPWAEEFFKWYDALEWYDSDNFDGYIGDRLKIG